MKVIYLINGLGTGGAERSLAEMLPRLQDRGVAMTVLCLYQKNQGVGSDLKRRGFDIRHLDAGSTVSRVMAVRSLLKSERPDVVHSTILEANVVARLAAAGTGTPTLTSLVNTPYVSVRHHDPNIRPWKLGLVKQVDGWTARRLTDHFHAITQAVKDSAVADLRIDPERVTVIPRGRDGERLGRKSPSRRRDARRALGLSDDALVLINVGRQERQKGQVHLLQAFQELADDYPTAVLLIAGRTGHSTPDIKTLVQRSQTLQERVLFLGHRTDVPDLLAASDVFVFPSLWEGLGGAAVEAMALGLPIVASDVPALREITEEGENATLVPPGKPTPLAAALRLHLDDGGLRRRYGLRSRAIYESTFTLGPVMDRMVDLYRLVRRG